MTIDTCDEVQRALRELKDKGVTSNIILVNAIDAEGTGKGTSLNEIASAILYLTSEEASRVNGTRLALL